MRKQWCSPIFKNLDHHRHNPHLCMDVFQYVLMSKEKDVEKHTRFLALFKIQRSGEKENKTLKKRKKIKEIMNFLAKM